MNYPLEEVTTMLVDSVSDNVSTENAPCFICWQNYPENCLELHSLRLICQYLKISSDYLVNINVTNTATDTNNDFFGVPSDYSVLLCSSCAVVTNKLVSLLQQLESTQMFINYQVQQLHYCFKTPVITQESTIGEESTRSHDKSYREVIAKECSKEVDKILETRPKVQVERIIIEKPTELETSDDDNYLGEVFEPIQQDYSDSEEIDDYQLNVDPPKPLITSQDDFRTHLLRITSHFYKLMADSEKQAECMTCKRLYKYRARGLFGDHIAVRHPERVFQHKRLAHVTPEQFTICCKHAVSLEVSSAERLKGESYVIVCPYCKHETDLASKLRLHMVVKHHAILEESITSLQKKGNIHKLSKVELSGTRKTQSRSVCQNWEQIKLDCKKLFKKEQRANKLKCSLCGNLAPSCNPQGHLINEHPETLFGTCKSSSNLAPEEFHELCANILEKEVNKTKRVKEQKAKAWHNAFSCHLCPIKVFTRNNVRYHLASKHYPILEENLLKATKQDSSVLKSVKAIRHGHGQSLKREQNGQLKKRKKQNYSSIESDTETDDSDSSCEQNGVEIKREAESDKRVEEKSSEIASSPRVISCKNWMVPMVEGENLKLEMK